jgi:hypothetical protein
MRLYLINPSNPLVSIVQVKDSRWNRYRVWKPLSLMVLAGLTPVEWEISILDENLGVPDYQAMPRPNLVGITAFTSQANRAYEVAGHFRRLGVPVVMGGIHATMCLDEVSERVDSVVTREADAVWPQVLEDVRQGRLKRRYDGGFAEMADVLPARQDLLSTGYAFGAIQTTRGCPLNCSFCSVTDVVFLQANPLVEEARNQVAVMRGPIVYCLESIDLPDGVNIENVAINPRGRWTAEPRPDLLGGITVLHGDAIVSARQDWTGKLYRRMDFGLRSRHGRNHPR